MIELSLSFKPIFKVSVSHSYYSLLSSRDIKIVPFAESEKLCRRLSLILKESDGSYFLLCDADKLDGLVKELSHENKVLSFSFFLFADNPYFINFTDTPLDQSSDIAYFTNRNANKSGQQILLHEGENVSRKDKVKILSFYELSFDQDKKVEIKDSFDNLVWVKDLKAGEKIQLSNQVLPLGKYSLFINGQQSDTFVLYTNIPAKRPIGIVQVFFSGEYKDILKESFTDLDVPFFDFKISYSSRNTYWKYLIIGKYNGNLGHTKVEGKENNFVFKGPEEQTLKNGQKAFVFTSESPLPIKQIYDFGFQLKSSRNGISNGKILIDSLPLASPVMIKPESRDSNAKIYSEIIVHL